MRKSSTRDRAKMYEYSLSIGKQNIRRFYQWHFWQISVEKRKPILNGCYVHCRLWNGSHGMDQNTSENHILSRCSVSKVLRNMVVLLQYWYFITLTWWWDKEKIRNTIPHVLYSTITNETSIVLLLATTTCMMYPFHSIFKAYFIVLHTMINIRFY